MGIFAKLADKGLSGCISVVGADGQKWGYFGGASCAAQCAFGWLVGVVQKFRQGRRLSSSDYYAHALWLFSFCFIGRALEKNMPDTFNYPRELRPRGPLIEDTLSGMLVEKGISALSISPAFPASQR